MRKQLLLCAILILLLLAGGVAEAQDGNLLQNPGFEQGFYSWSGIPEVNVGNGWTPWWYEDPNHDPTWFRPEYKPAEARDFANRVHSGGRAQQWFKLYSSFYAGIYQQVFDVTPGQNYRFSVWAQVWSSTEDNPPNVSTLPANPHLQIGIDPTGNWNAGSPDVVWSPESGMNQIIDHWGQLSVEATAQSDVVTVFVRTIPEFANKHNNIYVDDAVLALVGPPPPPPTNTPLPPTDTPVVTDTPVPTETPVPTNTPVPTETALPTETPAPTETPVPAETPSPTDTPVPTETARPPTETAPATEVAAADPTAPPAGADEVANAPEPENEIEGRGEDENGNEGSGLPCASPVLGVGLLGLAVIVTRRKREEG